MEDEGESGISSAISDVWWLLSAKELEESERERHFWGNRRSLGAIQ